MELMGIGSVAAITIICLVIGLWIKISPIRDKWIPCIVGTLGMALGVLGWQFMEAFPAQDMLTALAVGGVSGLAATGTHQIYKQLLKDYEDHPPNDTPEQDKTEEENLK